MDFSSLLSLAYNRKWNQLLAKGAKYAEVSLLNHAYSVASIVDSVLTLKKEYFIDNDIFNEHEMELAVVAAFLHDLDKENQEFQDKLKGLTKEYVQHLPSYEKFKHIMMQINYSENDAKFAFCCVLHTHLNQTEVVTISSIKSKLIQELRKEDVRTSSLIWFGDIIRFADSLSSAQNPTQVREITEREGFSLLIKQLELEFGFFEISIVRGNLSIILLDAAEKAFNRLEFENLVNFPNGMVVVSQKEKISYDNFYVQLKEILNVELTKLFTREEFLKDSINLQINRTMIGEETLVGVETLESLIVLAKSEVESKSYKGKGEISGKEQKEAIYLRFIISMILILKNRTNLLKPDKSKKFQEFIDETQEDIFGVLIDELGKNQKYEPFRDLLYNDITPHLIKAKQVNRLFNELDESSSLEVIEKLGKRITGILVPKLKGLDAFSIKTDLYLNNLLNDVSFPDCQRINGYLFSTIGTYYSHYKIQKSSIMGKVKNQIRCPICGTIRAGTIAKKASVGEGTKKFTNFGKGYGTLDNINICVLCSIEGILRRGKQLTFFVFPDTPLSYSQLSKIKSLYIRLVNLSMKRSVVYKDLIFSNFDKLRNELFENTHRLLKEDRKTFVSPIKLRSNFLVLSIDTFPKIDNISTYYALLLMFAIYIHKLSLLKIKIVQGLDILNTEELRGAVGFLATSTLSSALNLKQDSISYEDIKKIGKKLAYGYFFWKEAKLGERGGIINGIKLHPGRILARIIQNTKKKSIILNDLCYDIFKKLMVKDMENVEETNKEKIPKRIAELLDKYYKKKQALSMHAVLGPVNKLYGEYRHATCYDENTSTKIAGKVYRQLEMLSERKNGLSEAASEIHQICISMSSILQNMNPRKKKNYLEDLRYSVYLHRVMKHNKKFREKKNKKSEEEKE